MSFDPRAEDFQRTALRTLQASNPHDRFSGVRTMNELRRSFSEGRALANQTDGDRAYHLVVQATEHYDYELPFSTNEDAAQKLINDSLTQVQEALKLDPQSPDANRLRICISANSFEESYQELKAGAQDAFEYCTQELDSYLVKLSDPDLVTLARKVFMAPAYRWYATLADRSLICGRYKTCIDLCTKLRRLDTYDIADAYRTQALATAKLQDAIPLSLLSSRVRRLGRPMPDAWLCISQAYVAWANRKISQVDTHIQALLKAYPLAAMVLTQQVELPMPAFARVVVQPHSEDELAIATSEATVLLQEGQDFDGAGGFGAFLKNHPLVQEALTADKNKYAHLATLEGLNLDTTPGRPTNPRD